MKVAFGTDGIRGAAGVWPIVPEVAAALGRVAADRAPSGRVIVGGDPRPSSNELIAAVCAGVAAGGGRAWNAGTLPTSAVGVAVAADPGAIGIVVTASHNAWPENGFKWIGAGGRKPDDAAAAALSEAIEAALHGEGPGGGGTEPAHERVMATWETAMRAALPDLGALRGRRLAIDLANGASAACWPWLRALPVAWERVDGEGRVNDGVGSEHLERLSAAIVAQGCDGGLAVDGDGDRCALLDAAGRRVSGDAVLWRLALDAGVGGIVVTAMSTAALEVALPGVEVVRTDIGDRFVRAAMEATGHPLGGEESGHLLFSDFPAGDGLLGGIRALCAAFEASSTLAGAFSGLPVLPRALIRVPAGARRLLAERTALQRAAQVGQAALGPGGRVFLRYSGTEPVLRVLVEGLDRTCVDRVAAEVAAAALADGP